MNVDIKFFFFSPLTGGDIYEIDTYEILKNFLVLFIYSSITWEWGGVGNIYCLTAKPKSYLCRTTDNCANMLELVEI